MPILRASNGTHSPALPSFKAALARPDQVRNGKEWAMDLAQNRFGRLPGLGLNPVARLRQGLIFGLAAAGQSGRVSEGAKLVRQRDGSEGEDEG
jgi:hypothetical protein